ncbi:MAG: sulfotransferase [Gemmataceae bacterium]|nr:sulfotransferase [Gemmataceae bacterium]
MVQSAREFITIVTGLPRSGTSLMMQMLQAGGMPILTDNLRQADADNPRGYLEFEPVKQLKRDASWLRGAYGQAVKLVHLLLYDLPAGHPYRVLFLRRKLPEVVASQRAMLDRQGKKGASLPEDQLARLFAGQLTQVEAWLRERENFAVLDVSYNDLIAGPTGQADRINHFLGGGLIPAAMSTVVEPALYRQRK